MTTSFIQQSNVALLWEVISDEDHFKYLPPDVQSSVQQVFINNLKGFYANEKQKSTSLVEMNKKYIVLLLKYLKQQYPLSAPKKLTIHPEPVNTGITYEEIQQDRRQQSEREFQRKQSEFEEMMTVKAPPTPTFADQRTDQPIQEMDKLLKEMQAARNYDVEQASAQYGTTEGWLKTQETSNKKQVVSDPANQSQRFKHLNQLQEMEENKSRPVVTFNRNPDQVHIFEREEETEENENEGFHLLAKLKKKQPSSNEFREKIEQEIRELQQRLAHLLEWVREMPV